MLTTLSPAVIKTDTNRESLEIGGSVFIRCSDRDQSECNILLDFPTYVIYIWRIGGASPAVVTRRFMNLVFTIIKVNAGNQDVHMDLHFIYWIAVFRVSLKTVSLI